jgi:hypothetical protein
MKDVTTWLDRLRTEADECRLISKLATSEAKKIAFANLAATYDRSADDLQTLINSGTIPSDLGK